jgi:O-antigen ligase
MLGSGYSQAEKPSVIPVGDEQAGQFINTLVDNTYLALALHIGLVGMVVILGLLWAMWRRLRIETIMRPTPLLIGIASFWSTFLLTGMFNIQLAIYGFWFLIAIMILQRDGEADVGSPDLRQPDPLFALASESAQSVP